MCQGEITTRYKLYSCGSSIYVYTSTWKKGSIIYISFTFSPFSCLHETETHLQGHGYDQNSETEHVTWLQPIQNGWVFGCLHNAYLVPGFPFPDARHRRLASRSAAGNSGVERFYWAVGASCAANSWEFIFTQDHEDLEFKTWLLMFLWLWTLTLNCLKTVFEKLVNVSRWNFPQTNRWPPTFIGPEPQCPKFMAKTLGLKQLSRCSSYL